MKKKILFVLAVTTAIAACGVIYLVWLRVHAESERLAFWKNRLESAGIPVAKRLVRGGTPGLNLLIEPLREEKDGTLALNLSHGTVLITNLTVIKGMPLSHLCIYHTNVSDLSPLRGMRLRYLNICGLKVRDLTPIKGMPLEYLDVRDTEVEDIEAVRGMPLKFLLLNGCKRLKGLQPVVDCKELENLTIPSHIHEVEFLRKLVRLKTLEDDGASWQSVSAFWNKYDREHKSDGNDAK